MGEQLRIAYRAYILVGERERLALRTHDRLFGSMEDAIHPSSTELSLGADKSNTKLCCGTNGGGSGRDQHQNRL